MRRDHFYGERPDDQIFYFYSSVVLSDCRASGALLIGKFPGLSRIQPSEEWRLRDQEAWRPGNEAGFHEDHGSTETWPIWFGLYLGISLPRGQCRW